MAIFDGLSKDLKLKVLRDTSKLIRKKITSQLRVDELVTLLEGADPDEATDILRQLSNSKYKAVISELNEELRVAAMNLLQLDPKTAAGLMKVDYIQVDIDDHISSVVDKFRIHEKRTGKTPDVIVTKDGKLKGTLPVADLILAKPSEKIIGFLKKIPSVDHKIDYKTVVKMFAAHPHDKIAVVNSEKSVMGIIYSDDVLLLIREAESSSLYDFAGISDEETVFASAQSKVRFRARWLIINLFTAFLAAFAVSLFNETIAQYVALAIYMPIVAGMGGNAATQTLAVVVRGISLQQITLGTAWRTVKNEIIAGFINGLINAVIVAIVVILISQDFKLAIVLSIAMILNLVVAGFFGTLVPLVMTKLGKDPASSATVFITTATDVLGFIIFLGLGTLILT